MRNTSSEINFCFKIRNEPLLAQRAYRATCPLHVTPFWRPSKKTVDWATYTPGIAFSMVSWNAVELFTQWTVSLKWSEMAKQATHQQGPQAMEGP